MASMRESDTGLWLHNKLGATDELWAPPSIASLLTAAVIDNIRLCFHGLSSAVKLKLLLGTLHLPRRTVDEMKGALTEIIQLASLDSDPWVLMVADILKSFPDSGALNLDLEEQNPNVQDILGELREKVNECEASAMLPLECQYLNKNALTTLAGPLTPPVKHFQLKRKPKSATLRAELLQKSTETAQQLKRSAGVPFHAKGRGLLRKMDTTTPLKGIPKQAPFRSPTAPSVFSPAGNRTPIPPSRTPLRKERGVKLLDISELDVVGAGREAKRRRRALDTEAVEKPAKEETVVENATPDYAAGLVSTQKLGSLNSEPALPSTSYLPATPSVVPASSYVPSSETPPGERPAALPRDLRLALGAGGWAVDQSTSTSRSGAGRRVGDLGPQQAPLCSQPHLRGTPACRPAAPPRSPARRVRRSRRSLSSARPCTTAGPVPARPTRRAPLAPDAHHAPSRRPCGPDASGGHGGPPGPAAPRPAAAQEEPVAHGRLGGWGADGARGGGTQCPHQPPRRGSRCSRRRRCSRRPTRSRGQRRRSSWASWRAPEVGRGGGQALRGWGGPGPAVVGAARGWGGPGSCEGGGGAGPVAPGPRPAAPARPHREPVPGAGRRDPDQAERAHGGPAQVGRPGQHHHAGGHGLRDELRHRPVDALQEVQAHGQRVLGPPGASPPTYALDPVSLGRPGLVF
uniref:Negative elongation factor complex member A n=1 Tax=Bos mutus grunniens TaxID=30521 RepID=A0A8B9XU87_BOSMU